MNFVAKNVTILALVLSILSGPAVAMEACPEKFNFDFNVNNAALVFEGHYLSAEIYKYPVSMGMGDLKYSLIRVIEVDKSWLGAEKGQKIKFYSGMTSFNEEVLPEFEASLPELQKTLSGSAHFIFTIPKTSTKNADGIYSGDVCGTSSYDLISENITTLDKKFAAAIE